MLGKRYQLHVAYSCMLYALRLTVQIIFGVTGSGLRLSDYF